MIGQRRLRQVVEVALGLVPTTFLLLPFLLASALGTAMAAVAGGAVDRATVVLIGWVLAFWAGRDLQSRFMQWWSVRRGA